MKLNLKTKLLLLAPVVLLSCKTPQSQFLLPVLGPKSAQGEDTVYHRIADFSLTNQENENVSERTVKNKIYVANFFFATCQSICPEMSTNLVDVQREFAEDDSVLILSHSVNPLHDSVEVLKGYAASYGAKPGKWHLLTGDKKQIYELAKSSYLVNALEDDGTPEGFLHSELFLLVDDKGRMRGTYDGTDKSQVKKLIADIHTLKKENRTME